MGHRTIRLGLLAAFALVAASFAPTAHVAADVSHDPHKLSAEEVRVVLPAVCRSAIREKHQFKCAELLGYPSDGSAFNEHMRKASGEISLEAVAYGHFTSPNAQEAYVTYSGLEPHNASYGGGILLRRADSGWKPVHWFPGEQMDHCVSIPDPGPTRMLCLSVYDGMGETNSSVWIVGIPSGALKRVPVLEAQDGRATDNGGYYCKPAVAAHRGLLIMIDDLKRSHEPGVLAVSKIAFSTAPNVRDACTEDAFADVDTENGVARYRFSQGKITIDPLQKFAPVDY